MDETPFALPLSTPPVHERERADARRNRQRILDAAAQLIRDRGVEGLSMDDVATMAGVGKGTLYRRFGDRSSLFRALIEEPERDLQDGMIRGLPPLGPGAPPRERLHAFGEAVLQLLERNARLLTEADGKRDARFRHPVYAFQRTHVSLLLREGLGEDDPRVDYLADCLLAPLSPQAFVYQREQRGMALEEMIAGWRALVDGVLAVAG